MTQDFNYRAKRHVAIRYVSGAVYRRVPEAAVRKIVAAGAGEIVEEVDVE